jgi:hypothetical protein
VGRVNPNGVGFNPQAFLVLTQQGERDYGTGSGDFLIQWERFQFFSEFYVRRISPRDVPTAPFTQYGAWAQAHYTLLASCARRCRALRLDPPECVAAQRRLLLG